MFFETHKDKDPAESSKIVNKRSTYFFIGLSHFDVLENFICRRINYIYFVASILFDFNAITCPIYDDRYDRDLIFSCKWYVI